MRILFLTTAFVACAHPAVPLESTPVAPPSEHDKIIAVLRQIDQPACTVYDPTDRGLRAWLLTEGVAMRNEELRDSTNLAKVRSVSQRLMNQYGGTIREYFADLLGRPVYGTCGAGPIYAEENCRSFQAGATYKPQLIARQQAEGVELLLWQVDFDQALTQGDLAEGRLEVQDPLEAERQHRGAILALGRSHTWADLLWPCPSLEAMDAVPNFVPKPATVTVVEPTAADSVAADHLAAEEEGFCSVFDGDSGALTFYLLRRGPLDDAAARHRFHWHMRDYATFLAQVAGLSSPLRQVIGPFAPVARVAVVEREREVWRMDADAAFENGALAATDAPLTLEGERQHRAAAIKRGRQLGQLLPCTDGEAPSTP